MGPLVPDLIGNNLNLIAALVIGVLFGAILEQAGFSTSKKLVGLFYGYDFTVLRVFFTAGIVAMIGLMIFEHYGLIDISLIYINPTFFWSAIIGGIIMGLGFVIGGFCPGTSVCAAAIGKVDAMIFIVGSVIGIFIFAEGYPMFEEFYKSSYWGSPRMFETIGISQNLFAFIMIAFALISFWFVSQIENKVNKVKIAPVRFTPYYISIAVVGIALAVSAFMFPERKTALFRLVENESFVKSYSIPEMTLDEFAYRIMNKQDNKLQIFDLRPEKEFLKQSLPKSKSLKIDNLFEKEPDRLLSLKHKINVFVADDEITAKKAAIIATELGFKRIRILQGGLKDFNKEILNFKNDKIPSNIDEESSFRFRAKASKVIPELIAKNKQSGAVIKKPKRVLGGC